MKELYQSLLSVQAELKAPKSLYNSFGRYKYRSCENILEAVKPILHKNGLTLIISDEIVSVNERFYIKATATITNGETSTSTTAYAREDDAKKGMDGSQITGTASSYARKYALNGLFAIDDTKDHDTEELKNQRDATAQKQTESWKNDIAKAKTLEALSVIFTQNPSFQKDAEFIEALGDKKKEIQNKAV